MRPPDDSRNFLIAALDEDVRPTLLDRAEPATLATRQVLAEPGDRLEYVLFPTAGVISRLGATSDGRSIELACTGREGAVGTLSALADRPVPYRVVVQVAGDALRIRAAELRRIADRHAAVRHHLNGYGSVVLIQLTQASVCARFHTARQRLARWLLTASDRAGVGDLPWSHEWVAEMVGGPRSAVSAAASSLKDDGIISYRRRGITVLDHGRLASAACECAHIVRRAIEEFRSISRG